MGDNTNCGIARRVRAIFRNSVGLRGGVAGRSGERLSMLIRDVDFNSDVAVVFRCTLSTLEIEPQAGVQKETAGVLRDGNGTITKKITSRPH